MSTAPELSSSTIPSSLYSPVTEDRISSATNKHLEVFGFFSKLPAELRLKIWHTTFPVGRLVNLNYRPDFPYMDEQIRAMRVEAGLPIVTALYVNRESRGEALSNYCLLFKENARRPAHMNPARPTTPHSRPFCLNIKLDSVYISRYSLHNYWGNKWISYVRKKAPGLLQSIRTLEIRDMVWSPKVRTSFEQCQGEQSLTLPAAKTEEKAFYPSSLLKFTGLEEVIFFLEHPNQSRNLSYTAWGAQGGQEELEECLRKYFESHKDYFSTGRAPKVILKGWEELPDPSTW